MADPLSGASGGGLALAGASGQGQALAGASGEGPAEPDFSITAQPSNPDPVRLQYVTPTPSDPPAQPPTVPSATQTPATVTRPDDTLYLLVNGLQVTGWTASTVTRGIELFPSTFSISATELYPLGAGQVIAVPGDPCQIAIGSTIVLTGRVDQYNASFGPGAHTTGIVGRGLCRNLVDCTVDWTKLQGMQVNAGTMAQIATQLAAPYGVNVKSLSPGRDVPIPPTNISVTETPYSVIERLAATEGLLVYEDTDGSLVLNIVGTTQHASGVVEGVNIEKAAVSFTADNRYQWIDVFSTATYTNSDSVPLTSVVSVRDPTVKEYRRLAIVCESVITGTDIADQTGSWEVTRRLGRAQTLHVTIDSWRDSAGMLWTPNNLIAVNVPHCKIENQVWTIAAVTFRKDASGTHADLTIMPPQAFKPQPKLLYQLPLEFQLPGNAAPPGNPAAAAPAPAAPAATPAIPPGSSAQGPALSGVTSDVQPASIANTQGITQTVTPSSPGLITVVVTRP